jgi:predicted RecA/RadA family phage recombinase
MGRLIQNGGCFDYTNTGETTILSGDPVVVGDLVGVAVRAIEPGELGAVSVEGIYELTKDNAAIALGAAVYVTTAGKATASATNAKKAGYAVAAAAAGDATVKVILR